MSAFKFFKKIRFPYPDFKKQFNTINLSIITSTLSENTFYSFLLLQDPQQYLQHRQENNHCHAQSSRQEHHLEPKLNHLIVLLLIFHFILITICNENPPKVIVYYHLVDSHDRLSHHNHHHRYCYHQNHLKLQVKLEHLFHNSLHHDERILLHFSIIPLSTMYN